VCYPCICITGGVRHIFFLLFYFFLLSYRHTTHTRFSQLCLMYTFFLLVLVSRASVVWELRRCWFVGILGILHFYLALSFFRVVVWKETGGGMRGGQEWARERERASSIAVRVGGLLRKGGVERFVMFPPMLLLPSTIVSLCALYVAPRSYTRN
jgi:hypothetical protein